MNIKQFIKKYQKEVQRLKENPICHLVYTPFTGLGKPRFRGDEWYKYRIELFKNYTLKSLQNQSEQFFVHWISFRPEEQRNYFTKKLFAYLCGIKWRTIFTFGGLCWRDDKYKFDKIYQRLKDTLPTLEEIVGDAKYVYETVVPSDDMYHTDAFRAIQDQPFGYKRALVHWNGYVFNHKTKQLAEWRPPKGHLPPFYTITYPADVFLDPKKHLDYMGNFKSHEDIEKLFECVRLPDWRYCVSVHDQNISTSWNEETGLHRFIKNEIKDKKKKKEILKNFGIDLNETKNKNVKLS